MDVVVGIFVGGASRRMGRPKGLLPAPGNPDLTLVERLLGEVNVAAPFAPCFLVGDKAEYSALGIPNICDERPESGPLGGLVALLERTRELGAGRALALACDHPYLEARILSRLLVEAPEARIYCPYIDDRYQPLVARYHVDVLDEFRSALGRGALSLQPLVRAAPAECILLSPDEQMSVRDWDTPEEAGRNQS